MPRICPPMAKRTVKELSQLFFVFTFLFSISFAPTSHADVKTIAAGALKSSWRFGVEVLPTSSGTSVVRSAAPAFANSVKYYKPSWFGWLTDARVRRSVRPTASHVILLPNTKEGFQSMFPMNASEYVSYALKIRNFSEFRNSYTVNKQTKAIDLFAFIEESTSNIVSFTGHNQGSGQIAITSIESVAIEELFKHCVAVQKLCIFISCNSKDFVPIGGISGQISVSQATKIIERLDSEFLRLSLLDDDISFYSLVSLVDGALGRKSGNGRVQVVVVGGGAGVLVSLTPSASW